MKLIRLHCCDYIFGLEDDLCKLASHPMISFLKLVCIGLGSILFVNMSAKFSFSVDSFDKCGFSFL